jgi:hypothetical protein
MERRPDVKPDALRYFAEDYTVSLTDAIRIITPVPYQYHSIFVVGAGGVGARVVQGLVKTLGEFWDRNLDIYVIDADRVEERNVGRQLFTHGDIGKYKAEVVAMRYHQTDRMKMINVFPVINTIEKAVSDDAHFAVKLTTAYPLVIGCVDNVETRQFLLHYLRNSWLGGDYGGNSHRGLYIDCGSDGSTGQVLLAAGWIQIKGAPNTKQWSYTSVEGWNLLPDLFNASSALAEQSRVTPSCAEGSDTQTALSNALVAHVAVTATYRILKGEQLPCVGWKTNAAACQVDQVRFKPSFIARSSGPNHSLRVIPALVPITCHTPNSGLHELNLTEEQMGHLLDCNTPHTLAYLNHCHAFEEGFEWSPRLGSWVHGEDSADALPRTASTGSASTGFDRLRWLRG